MQNTKIIFWLKLFCIALLFLSFIRLPIGYYTFLRIVVTGTAIYSAYFYYINKNIFWFWLFGLIAIIFNPLIPLYFDKTTWFVIDIITGIIFLVSVFILKEHKEKKSLLK